MQAKRFSTKTIVRSDREAADPSDFPSRFLETMALQCADGVYAVDLDQRIVFWSQTAEQLTGRMRDEVIGRRCYEVMLGGDSDGNPFCRRECPTIVAARRGRSVCSYDLQVPTTDGRDTWYNMSIIPLRQSSTRTNLVVHMFRDVTNRRVAELLAQETLAAVARFSETRQTIQEAHPPQSGVALTTRELDVLRLLAKGLTTPQIAQRLGIARATARNHADRMLSKLDVHSRLEAVVRAGQLGLV